MGLNISNGQKFISGSDISVASDLVSVSKLDFYLGDELKHSATQAPWEYTFKEVRENKVDSNALIHYRFNEEFGEIALDSSNNQIHGQIVMSDDVLWTDGKLGSGIKLGNDPVSPQRGYINIPTNGKLQSVETSFTVSCWLRGDPEINHTLFSNIVEGSGTSTGINAGTLAGNGRIDFFLNSELSGNTYRLRTSTAPHAALRDLVWKHYCWVYDGSTLKVFVDGLLDTSIFANNVNVKSLQDWKINTNYSLGSRGRIQYDDLRIYSHALTEGEIEGLLNAVETGGDLSITVVANDGASTETVDVTVKDTFDRANGKFQLLFNTGSLEDLMVENRQYLGDDAYSYYFSSSSSALEVAGQSGIYSTERRGEQVYYAFHVPNGVYKVETRHLDTVSSGINQTVFDVEINGQIVDDALDLCLLNNNEPVIRVYENVFVYDNILEIKLSASRGTATVSGMDISFVDEDVPLLPTLDISISTPESGAGFIEGGTVTVTATTPENVDQVEVYKNGRLFQTLISSPYTYVWDNAKADRDEDALLHLRFDGTLVDYSPVQNDAIFQNGENATWIEGRKGNSAIKLGGSSSGASRSYVLVPESPSTRSVGGAVSVMYWIRGAVDHNHTIFCTHEVDGPGINIVTLMDDGRTDFVFNQNITEQQFRLRSSPTTNGELVDPEIWKHYAWVYDGNEITCYVNGAHSNSAILGSIDFQSNGHWLINSNELGSRGEADYDDFRVYDHAISLEKVLEAYNDNPSDVVSLTAKIGDDQVEWGLSDPANITISKPNRPPVIRISYPFDNLDFEDGDLVPISFICGDPDGEVAEVRVYVNDELLATLSGAEREYVWQNVPIGKLSIRIEAIDNDGMVGVSPTRTIDVGVKDITPRLLKRNQIETIIADNLLDTNDDPDRPRFALDDVSQSRQTATGMEVIHIRPDTGIVRVPGRISNRFEVDIFHPRPYNNSEELTYRAELRTHYNRISNAREGWYSVSFYFDENQINDSNQEGIYQWHISSLFNNPLLTCYVINSQIHWQVRWVESGLDNAMRFCVGPVRHNEWMDFIFYIKLSNDIEDGRFKLWLNRKLARLYNPVTNELWQVPTVENEAEYSRGHAALVNKGTLPNTVEEDGRTVSVLDWFGRTTYPLPAVVAISRKWGIYKYGWNHVDPADPLASETETVNRVLYYANMNYANASSPDRNIFELLDADGLRALDGIDYNDHTAPATITSPTNGALIGIGTVVNVKVSLPEAAAVVGTIELLINGTVVYSTTEREFTYAWGGFGEGPHELMAIVNYVNLGYIESNTTHVTAAEGIREPIRAMLGTVTIDTAVRDFLERSDLDGGSSNVTSHEVRSTYKKLKDYGFNLVNVPSAHKAGKLYSVSPVDGSGDFTVSRNGSATYFDKYGLIKFSGNNEPRLQYDPSTSEFMGLLVETENTNMVNGPSHNGTTYEYSADIIIDGHDSVLVKPTSDLRSHEVQFNVPSGYTHYASQFIVKYAGSRYIRLHRLTSSDVSYNTGVVVDLIDKRVINETGNILDTKITPLINGWIKIDISSSLPGGWRFGFQFYDLLSGNTTYEGDPLNEGMLLGGVMLIGGVEPMGLNNSLIVTDTSQVTRPADIISLSDLKTKGLLGQDEGTIYCDRDGDKIAEIFKDGSKYTYKNGVLEETVPSDVPDSYQLSEGLYKAVAMKNTVLSEQEAIQLTS